MKRYRAQWRRQYKAKAPKRMNSLEAFYKAIELYKRGVKNDDREALLAAQRLLDMMDREEIGR